MANSAKIINFPEQEITQGHEQVKADTDNGYYRVANELGLALCKVRLSDRESRLVHAVMIKTFGFNKSMDWVCNGQLSELTNIDEKNISRVKKSLLKRNIVIVDGKKIGINPLVSDWVISDEDIKKPSALTVNKNRQPRRLKPSALTGETVKNVNLTVSPDTHNRQDTITKDTITKDMDKIPISTRIKKTDQFKKFFKLYPAHRKGGTDAQAWKAWKSEKLTTTDAQAALDWITFAAKTNPEWGTDANGQYIFGITNFIRDKKWLTPIPKSTNQNNGNHQSVNEHNQEAMSEWLSRHPQTTEIEVNPNEE